MINNAEKISNELDGKRSGDGFVCLCPAHDDRNPSLSIKEDNGRLLVHCHAGCPAETVIGQLKRRGLWPSTGGAEEPEAIYQYRDASGTVLFEKLRYPGKRFLTRRPDGSGGFVYNLDGTERVLYRLPEILKAIEQGREVIITEGEKDADSLSSIGFSATTTYHGAPKWNAQHNSLFKGAKVLICGDNDETGRKHVELIFSSLNGIAADVKIVQLPQLFNEQKIKDITDWLSAGGSREEFLELVNNAASSTGQKGCAALVVPLQLDAFLCRPAPPRTPMVGSWLLERMPIMIAGEPGCGKSLAVHSLCYCLATGTDFLDWKVERPRKVGLFDSEMADSLIQARLSWIMRGIGKEPDPVNLRILTRDLFIDNEVPFPDLRRPDERKAVFEKFEGVDLLVLDNLNSFFDGGRENSSEFWADIEQVLFDARKHGMAICLVHHTTKSNPRSPAGSSRNTRIVEVALVLQKVPTDHPNAAHFNLYFQKTRELTSDTRNKSARIITENGVSRWETGELVHIEEEGGKGQRYAEAVRMKNAGASYRQVEVATGVKRSTLCGFMKRSDVQNLGKWESRTEDGVIIVPVSEEPGGETVGRMGEDE